MVRLDPSTLTVRVARRLFPPLAGIASGSLTSQPALGAGALWAVSGNELDLELVRMDPRSLQILGHTRIPTAGPLYQALNNVIADDQRVYVTGSAIQELDRNGSPIARRSFPRAWRAPRSGPAVWWGSPARVPEDHWSSWITPERS